MDIDLSLIEISGADDSLLQQETLNGDACNVYSSCSPLCSIRSKPSPLTFGMTRNEGAEESGSTSSTGSFNKENVNLNKSDTLKLSLEPQQMKRKKKGGGYNLRKSLAWDKAFLTEEGVLDPMELSMISGNLGCLGGEKLSVIHEEERESLSELPEAQDDSADMVALEEKLFKDLPTMAAKDCKAKTPRRTPLKHDGVAKIKNNVVLPSPRNTPQAKRKVLSAQDINKSGSKSTCGQRPTASSLTANVNAIKAASKDSKALRLPVSKQEPTTISSTSRSNIPTGQLKRTQPAQPVISTPKNVRVKSSSNNAKTAGSTALIGLGGKSSTAKFTLPQAKRNVSNAAAKTRSSTHKTPVDMPTSRLSHECDDGSRTTEVSLPQKIQPVAGPRQNVQIQTAKPSGLRMPSPSMGFFGQQAKASATRNLLHRYTQSDDVPQPISANLKNPSSVKALSELRPPRSNAKASGMVNGVANENIRLNLRQGSSSSHSLRSDLHEKKKSDVELHNLQKLRLKTNHDLRSETSSTQQDLQSSADDVSTQHRECARPCESAKKLQTDDEEMKMKEKLHRIQTNSCISSIKHGDEMASDVSHEEEDMNHEEVEKSKLTSHVTLALENTDFSVGKNIVDFQPMQVSLSLAVTNVSGSGTQQVLPSLQETEPSKDFQGCDSLKNSDVSVVLGDDTASEKKRSQALNVSEGKEHEEGDFVGMRNSSKKMKFEDAENPFLPMLQETEPSKNFQECDSSKNFDVSVVLGDDTASEKKRSQALNGSEGKEHEEDDSVGMQNSSKKMKIEEAENPFLDSKITAGRSSTSPSCSILEGGEFTKYGDGEGHAELPCCTAVQDVEDVEESLEANDLLQAGNCGSRLNISNVPFPEPLTMQATSGDLFEVHLDGKVELCEEVKCEGQLTGSSTNSESSSTKFARDAFGAMEMGNRSSMCHMFSTVETEDSSTVADFVEDEVLEDKHCPQYVENISSTVHPWDGIRSSREDTAMYNALITSNLDAHEQSTEIIGPNHYSSEPDMPPQGDNLMGSSEQEQSFNSSNMVIDSPDVKGLMVTEAKASQAPLQKEDVNPKGDDMIEAMEAGQKQLGNDCLSNVCTKNNLSSSAAKTELSLVADLDECHENQNCFKVENYIQHSQGMAEIDCSLKEPSEEDLVNDRNHSEPLSSDLCIAAESNMHDVSSIMDKNSEKVHIEDVASSLVNENKQSDIKIEVDVSAEMIGEPIQELQNIDNSQASCSLGDELCSTSSDTQIELSVQQVGEDSKLKSGTLLEGPVPTHQVTDNSEGENYKCGQKQDAAVVKPPPDAAPFSDEWLAAFEAAGEEILTKKSGAVQNSPPEKTLPEPGPWSPVKKKNNQVIGPFDCTKCTNANINVPHSSPQ